MVQRPPTVAGKRPLMFGRLAWKQAQLREGGKKRISGPAGTTGEAESLEGPLKKKKVR